MADPRDDRVELTELDVISRYSLAVRTASASRDELIETLRADLSWLEGGRRARPAAKSASRAPSGTARKTAAKTVGTARRGR